MDKKQVKTVLTGDFSGIDNFIENIIYPIFGEECFEKKDVPEQLVTSESKAAADIANVSSILNVGTISNIKSEDIELFDVTLKNTSDISRSRVGIQRLIRSALSQYSHAFIVFHYKDCENKEWRFSYLHKEGTLKNTTSAKRYTYVFGNEHNPRTATERFEILANSQKTDEDLMEAFSVEALSLEFFSKYEEHYNRFVNYLIVTPAMQRSFKNVLKNYNGMDDAQGTLEIYKTKYKPLRDYVKKMMGRIVFMYFLERKGWLAGNKSYMKELYSTSNEKIKNDFLDNVLEPLFFGVLNTPKNARKSVFEDNGWNINFVPNAMELPYLNGGLFEQDEIDKCDSKFPKEYFEELFQFFSEYNFTVDENDPNDEEMGIDPEMLSVIFESLLEDNKGKGAFYTPKPEVQYMCREALIFFLHEKTKIKESVVRRFVENTDDQVLPEEIEKNKMSILRYLQGIKVCDPAIGSGAFPMGMLNLLVRVRLALCPVKNKNSNEIVELKKSIIQNNIYGVDIEKGAIDIARLRFWLSIVVDCKCDYSNAEPLPNFDYKFMEGNSLIPTFGGVFVNLDVANNKVARGNVHSAGTIVKKNLDTLQELRHDYYASFGKDKYRKEIEIKELTLDTVKEFFEAEQYGLSESRCESANLFGETANKKSKKREQIEKQYKEVCDILKKVNDKISTLRDNSIPLYDRAKIDIGFFDWKVCFSEVMENGGFDIVIGNPPYIDSELMTKIMPELRELYTQHYKSAKGNWDIYIPFYELGMNLASEKGCVVFITPNKWVSIGYGQALRELYFNNFYKVCDCSQVKVFEAGNEPLVCCFSKENVDSIVVDRAQDNALFEKFGEVPKSIISCNKLGVVLSPYINILCKMDSNKCRVKNFSEAENPFTTAEAYDLIDLLKDDCTLRKNSVKLINTGTIDPYVSLWGVKTTAYLKNKYEYPIADMSLFEKKFPKRTRQVQIPKLIITGMRYFEVFYDESGKYIAGKSTIIIPEKNQNDSLFLLGLLNSSVISFYINQSYSTLGIGGGINFSPDLVDELPVPDSYESIKKNVIEFVKKILETKNKSIDADVSQFQEKIDEIFYTAFKLKEPEIKMINATLKKKKDKQN